MKVTRGPMNIVEWLLYAAACQYVKEHEDGSDHVEWHPAADVVTYGATKRGFRYVPGIFHMPATAHVNYRDR